MATLVAIAALAGSRPAVDAGPVTLASWYERKAAVLHQVADDTATAPSERDIYARWAADAHAHAMRLHGGDR
ncbi:MAG: hypothetical protein GEV28_32525 [Actinophytocola sp.]|uniref:hypothetical protein n=1 Tax=Actinophytocola sp. TaxID=1872138 RepID=UPI0013268A02|nr:hypothetical protein [Actinophytocola sp.]MPZ84857.1 hypothetical protein [Actinophytocola sp.]